MPPEPSPWDRKEFFRDRKYGHDRPEPFGPGLGSRWRDSSSSYGGGGCGGLHRNNSMDFSPRWGFPSDFHRPLGHVKHGGWHMYHEDYPAVRSGDRFIDPDGFRPAIPRGEGRYGRFYRENRSSYGHKEWRHHWEPNHHRNTLPNTPSRPRFVNEPRSDPSDQFHSKEQAADNANDANGSSTGPKLEKEESSRSREWKPLPLKWSRSGGSFTSRGSKSNAGEESNDMKGDSSPKNVSPIQSPSDNAVVGTTCVVPCEETGSKKKPRLRWGEGLAKYEKKKVEVPEDENASKVCVEPTNTPTSYLLVDKSPRVLGFSDCSSPATPSSFACSSSPGMEDKACVKTTDADTNNCSVSSMPTSDHQLEEEFHFDLDKLQLDSISNLTSLLNELLQASERYPADSAFVKSSALNKLLLWKGDISKELESTETEIDSLETELKSLNTNSSLNSLLLDCKDGPVDDGSVIPRPPPLEARDEGKYSEIDSPGTATSKLSEPIPISTIPVTHNFDVHTDIEKSVDKQDDDIHDVIINSNKGFAAIAFEELCKVSPSYDSCVNSLEVNIEPGNGVDLVIKDKFLKRKKFMKFKEKVMALKYRAFQHTWKEELRLLSLKNQRLKMPKKSDLGSRILHGGIQKKRLSIRSRFSTPAQNLSQVPTADIISYTGKLLSESPPKIYRSSLKMPPMILDDKEKTTSRFVSSNGFVEDPYAIEKERTVINPWTLEEKEIFLKQFGIHGKDFSTIASFLDHKTTADCIQFYYKNHKSDWFVKTKKKPEVKKQGKPVTKNPYLMTPGNRLCREMNAASLDILGAASIMAAQADEAIKPSRLLSGKSNSKKPSGEVVHGDERETEAADVLAGICGSLSSEAMGSCITSVVEQQKAEVTQNVDDDGDACSSDESEMGPIDWTDDERCLFVEAFSSYGKDFVMVSRFVRTKSRDQCKVFFSKARKCLGLDSLAPRTGDGGALHVNVDANGGGSDGEDAGIVENGSVICSDKSGGSRGEDVSKPEALSTEVDSIKQSEAVDDGVVRVEDVKSGDDTCRVKDPTAVSEDDTCKVGCSRGGVDNPQHSFSGDSIINGDESSRSLNFPTKVERSTVTFQNCYIRKCNQNLPSPIKSEARSDNHTSSSSSKVEKPTRNGDVKLFGKILRKPSSVESDGNKFDVNLTVNHDINDHDSLAGLENVPIRSYGFWDGTKIQTGFPSLPDSALLLAKYSSTFSSYPATVNVDECNLNGACVFSPREFSNNGNMVEPNREKVHPLSVDLEPGRETRNGFDGMSGICQRGKGFVKLNVVQGGDMLVGGSCTSVPDQVAALKLHYAGAQPYGRGGGGGGNGIVREERR